MRTKKSILNFLTDAGPQILIFVIGVFKLKIFLHFLQEDTLGLYQLYGQLIGYLNLFEGGLTGAVLYRLFKPVADKDHSKINSIIGASRIIFNIIGCVIFLLGIIFSFLIPYFIKDNPFSQFYISTTFILYIVSNVIYYFTLSYKVLLDAEQKTPVNNIVIQSSMLLKSIVEILVVVLGGGLYGLVITSIIITSISNLILVLFCRKTNSFLHFKEKRDYSMLGDVKNVIVHKLAGLISNNMDLVIVSSFMGLSTVVVYSSYNYICNAIKQIIAKINASLIPVIGNLLVTDIKKSETVFLDYSAFVFFIGSVLCIPLFLAINPFIELFYEGQIQTSFVISLFFVLILYYSIIRQPLLTYSESSGLFKETRKCPLIEVVINLLLSLILVFHFGIGGILFATLLSLFISEFLIKPKVIYQELFYKKATIYYKKSFFLFLLFVILFLSEYFIHRILQIIPHNIVQWFLIYFVFFIVNFVINFILYRWTNNFNFITYLKMMLKRRKYEEG